MNILILLISLIFGQDSFRHSGYSYSVGICGDNGGFQFDGTDLICWGDSKEQIDTIIRGKNFFRTAHFPATFNSVEYGGGMYFATNVDYIVCHYDKNGGLDEISIMFTNWKDELNYHILNSKYNWLRKIFNKKIEYDVGMSIEDFKFVTATPDNKIFKREYSSCDGDCGSAEYNGEILDMEIIAFMTGKATQVAYYENHNCKVAISVSLNRWMMYNVADGQTKQYTMKYPYATLTYYKPVKGFDVHK